MSQQIKAHSASLDQVQLDPKLTIDSATAVLAAYADFDRQPVHIPPGYKCITHFTGWDQIFYITGREERFGLVLQSLSDPETYMIAFRGTNSWLDMYEDIWISTAQFVPYHNDDKFPDDVLVASGFYGLYTGMGGSMKASMQTQLFTILDQLDPAPSKVLICGHSLGSSLASLFALDVAVSRPSIQVVNTNFASPRTGKETWQRVYDNVYNLESSTFRIANYWDIVPSLPPTVLGYHHVGKPFLVSFFVKDAFLPHYPSRHSMLNYQTVVDHAVTESPQVWVGEFPDAAVPGWLMESTRPPSETMPEWASHLAAMEAHVLETS